MTEITNKDKYRLRLQELEALNDKCRQAQQQIELYQAQIFIAVNKKKIKKQIFKKGDIVLTIRRPIVMIHKTKESLTPNRKDLL